MIKLTGHTKNFIAVIIVMILICAWQTYYIDMSSRALMEETDIIISRLEKGDMSSALKNTRLMQEMWKKSSVKWQSLLDHELVGRVFEDLYLLLSCIEQEQKELALIYASQLKYSLWDVYSLDKLAFENIF